VIYRVYILKKGLYIRVEDSLLRALDKLSAKLGYTRSEAVREAVRRFIITDIEYSETRKIRGLVKSKLSLRELEEAYEALR
jgi:metal-responsive CopG/Arc/MetJ family transcriptional regulator